MTGIIRLWRPSGFFYGFWIIRPGFFTNGRKRLYQVHCIRQVAPLRSTEVWDSDRF